MSEPGTIYYTTNGTTPTNFSPVYSSPIPISTNTTLEYMAQDLAGNKSPIYTQNYIIDKVAPKVITTNPPLNSLNIPPNQIIEVTFSEPIKAGNMWIELENSTGKLTVITASISGNVLTINHSALLTNGKYSLALHTGSVTDLAGNPLAFYGSSFTVDSIPPIVKTVTPVKNTINVPITPVIKFNFSEPIKYGKTPWIEFKSSNGTAIPFTSNISGSTLNIKSKSPLAYDTTYTIVLHSNSITDLAGNGLVSFSTKFTTIQSYSGYGLSFNYPSNWGVETTTTQNGVKLIFVTD